MTQKPQSASCDDNQQVIFEAIQPYLKNLNEVFEVASGTGQHAIYFSSRLTHISWQTSELEAHLSGIHLWLDEAKLANVLYPVELDVSKSWPQKTYDAVFSANALHIMSHAQVEHFIDGVSSILNDNGICLIYGPFNYQGNYTSQSNQRFDQWLKQQHPDSCIKDFEWLIGLAEKQNLNLFKDQAMPCNNRLLILQKLL